MEHLRAEMVVDADWLEAHLHDSNLRIVDCDSRGAYERAHIPGAAHSAKHPYKDPDRPLHVMAPEQFAGCRAATAAAATSPALCIWSGRRA